LGTYFNRSFSRKGRKGAKKQRLVEIRNKKERLCFFATLFLSRFGGIFFCYDWVHIFDRRFSRKARKEAKIVAIPN